MESITKPRRSPQGSGITAPTVRPWADLSPDLLLDISNRLDDAADYTRFHAVCTPWRDAAPSLFSTVATRPTFSPWLLGPCRGHMVKSTVDIQRTSSFEEAIDGRSDGDVVLAEPPGALSTEGDRNWVASADGTASWLFVASPEPRLHHLLTGAVTPLPSFPNDDEIRAPMENARGIVYGDGTVFLYRFLLKAATSTFTAAILRPGDTTTWTVMKRILEVPTGPRSDAGAVYHDGKVLVCVSDYFWSVLTPGDFGGFAGLQARWRESEKRYSREFNHVLESQGELLWASVLLEHNWSRFGAHVDLTSALSVTVHALEQRAGGVMRWAARDGWSLADRILFLGSPASFAVDAHKLGMNGGCAYFVFRGCVFRYGLVDGKTELVKQLRRGWDTIGARLWNWRQPTIAPIQEIRECLRLHPTNKKPKICN